MPRHEARSTAPVPERAILVGVDHPRQEWPIAESMAELERLACTDGAEVVATYVQRLDHPVPKTFIGSGKVEEIAAAVRRLDADVVIFDDELTPSQQSNLEGALGEPTKVIDRCALILDIFGNHARTRAGRLQVQLAQLQYLYPRLRGMWSHLVGEQTRGGIGSRFGQGESQLEVDRRLIRNKIHALKNDLKTLAVRREVQGKARHESGVWRVALAGYTNAGKSTLLNALSGSDVYAKDELFATLDPTTRMVELDEGRRIVITDTVGFIQKLPTTLVESFKSTLAEIRSADLVLKVVDASDKNAEAQLACVDDILRQIGAHEVASVVVLNKSDAAQPSDLAALEAANPGCETISALTGAGMSSLTWRIAHEASERERVVSVLVPYDKGSLMNEIHQTGQVLRESYEQGGTRVTARVNARLAAHLECYALADDSEAGEAPQDA